jgi:hypothetical protein
MVALETVILPDPAVAVMVPVAEQVLLAPGVESITTLPMILPGRTSINADERVMFPELELPIEMDSKDLAPALMATGLNALVIVGALFTDVVAWAEPALVRP